MKNRNWIIIFFVLLIFGIITGLFFNLNIKQLIISCGIFAPIIYILIMALAIIISPIPSIPLTIISGVLFGWVLGGLYSVIGALIGSMMAFFISKKFFRGWALKKFKKEIKVFDNYEDNSLMIFIFLTRLLPIFQFDIISYGAGLTKIKWWKFMIATLLGMAPITLFISYYGESIIKSNIWISVTLTFLMIFLMWYIPRKFKK
jgi:uncharacterized membrane protein YdjX (TVP38/TMEM64 family)